MAETWLFWTSPWVDSSHYKNLKKWTKAYNFERNVNTSSLWFGTTESSFVSPTALVHSPLLTGVLPRDIQHCCHWQNSQCLMLVPHDLITILSMWEAVWAVSVWMLLLQASEATLGNCHRQTKVWGQRSIGDLASFSSNLCKGCLIPELETVLSLSRGNAADVTLASPWLLAGSLLLDATLASPWLLMTAMQFSLPAPIFPFLELPSYICFQLHTISVVLLTDNR